MAPSDGSIYANRLQLVNLATQRDMHTVLDAALDHRDCGSGEQCRYRTWAQTTGSGAKLTGADGADASRFGLLGGVDRLVGDTEPRLGVEAGASRLNTHDGAGGYGHTDDAHVGLYGMAPAGPLELSGAMSFQRARHYLSRLTGVGNALADVDSRASTVGVQLAWPWLAAHWHFAPTMGVLYQHHAMEDVHETVVSTRPLADSFGLDGHHETFDTLQAYGSVSLGREFQHRQVTYVPRFALGYRRNVRGGAPAVVMNARDGTAFALRGAQVGRNMATVDVGLAVSGGKSWSMSLAYRGLFASGLRDNAASFGFTRHF